MSQACCKVELFYAIEIISQVSGEPFLAIGGTGAGPILFYWHKDAVKIKNGFCEHGFKPARVVHVKATYEWEGK
jgi:hypothetical protein